jgi:transcriptional regulator with XRE-family HTH domain
MSTLRKRLGKAIRRLRADKGYSQESFASHVKVHRTFMGAVERGEQNLSLDSLEKIARGLGITAAALLAEAEFER